MKELVTKYEIGECYVYAPEGRIVFTILCLSIDRNGFIHECLYTEDSSFNRPRFSDSCGWDDKGKYKASILSHIILTYHAKKRALI